MRPGGRNASGIRRLHRATCKRIADKTVRSMDTLLELPVSKQNSFLRLRMSLQLRTARVPRWVTWEQVDAAMQRVATKVTGASCDILHLEIGEDPSACLLTRQMSLPHRCGGLG